MPTSFILHQLKLITQTVKFWIKPEGKKCFYLILAKSAMLNYHET